jgi:hypothetical protein
MLPTEVISMYPTQTNSIPQFLSVSIIFFHPEYMFPYKSQYYLVQAMFACKTETSDGHTTTTAWYVSFRHGTYSGPKQSSLAWVFVNEFADSR